MSPQSWFYLGATLALMLAMALMLGRLFAGPTLYDRTLAVNSFGSKTVLFLCAYGFITGRADGVDIALLYALVNFISTIAVLKFFRYRSLGVALTHSGKREAP
jgi:multicomponent Na+:H+ antiporter subunit F